MKILILIYIISFSLVAGEYNRSDWPHWKDLDSDCQNTRNEVLIAESLSPVTLDETGCKVVSGFWYDPFTGNTYTNPRKLDVDHFVPLAEVYRSGGDKWDREKRTAYANDLTNQYSLIAVSLSANRSKGDRDPAEWLPPNEAFHCEYVKTWIAIKRQWQLTMDTKEEAAIQLVIAKCSVDL